MTDPIPTIFLFVFSFAADAGPHRICVSSIQDNSSSTVWWARTRAVVLLPSVLPPKSESSDTTQTNASEIIAEAAVRHRGSLFPVRHRTGPGAATRSDSKPRGLGVRRRGASRFLGGIDAKVKSHERENEALEVLDEVVEGSQAFWIRALCHLFQLRDLRCCERDVLVVRYDLQLLSTHAVRLRPLFVVRFQNIRFLNHV